MPDTTTDATPQPTPLDESVLNPGASRRAFLAGTSAMALAAGAGASAVLAFPDRPTSSAVDPQAAADALADPRTVVAYIVPGSTEVTIMSGDREVVVDDPSLARLLLGKVG